MFFTYRPQGPTTLCNSPPCERLKGNNFKKIECTEKSEEGHKELICKLANAWNINHSRCYKGCE